MVITVRKMTVVSLVGAGLVLAGCASGHAGDTPAGGSSLSATASAGSAGTGSTAAAGTAAGSAATAASTATASASAAPEQRPRALWLASVRMASASSGWALGLTQDPAKTNAAQLLARTSDGGRTWADVTPTAARAMLATKFAAAALDVTDAEHAYLAVSAVTQGENAADDPTAVFATADGGRTWTESAPFRVTGALVQMTFADATHGWLLLDTGGNSAGHPLPWLYRTTDGRHWAPAASAEPPGSGGTNNMCQKLGLAFPTATTGWLHVGCRSGEFLVRSSDGGGTWRPQSLPLAASCTAPGAQCTVFGPQLSGETAFVTIAPMTTSPAPSLVATSDLGHAWQPVGLPSGAGQYPQVSFFTPADGLLVAMGSQAALGRVFYTTDNAGTTWSPVPQGRHFTQLGASVDFANPRDGIEWTQAGDAQGGTPPALYATTDSGRTWTPFVPMLIS
jgi:hypothetical protein